MCDTVVQTLYPQAHQELRDSLTQSMVDRYVLLLANRSRQAAMQSQRQDPSAPLAKLDEELSRESMEWMSQDLTIRAQTQNQGTGAVQIMQNCGYTPSQSDIPSVNASQVRRMLNHSSDPRDTAQPSSVVAGQSNYPKPPMLHGKVATCDWCSAPLEKGDLEPHKWK